MRESRASLKFSGPGDSKRWRETRKVERMRRAEEIAKLEETAKAVQEIVEARKAEIDEDPLSVHPAEVKQRIEDLEPVKQSLRPAPIVLHLDGLRVKVPFEETKEMLGNVDVFGRKLSEISTIRPSRLGGSTMIRILTKAQVASKDAKAAAAQGVPGKT